MIDRGRLLAFSLAASIAYTLAYYFNWPLFVYYPLVNQLHITRQAATDGFPILWYGWLATAVLVGLIAGWLLPRRWTRHLPFDLAWIVPVVLIVAAFAYEKRWF